MTQMKVDNMYLKSKKDGRVFKLIQILIDVALVNLGFYCAFLFRFDFNPSPDNIRPFFEIIPFISIFTLLIFSIYGVFSMIKYTMIENIYSIILSVTIIDITTVATTFFTRGFGFPRSIFIIGWFIQIAFLVVWKTIVLQIEKRLNKQKSILIVGEKEEAEKIAKKIIASRRQLENVKYICSQVDVGTYKLIDDVDEVFICASLEGTIKTKIMTYCVGRDKVVYIVPELFEIALIRSKMEQFDDVPTFKVDNLSLSIENRIAKRLLDLIASLIGIIITLPIMLIVAIGVKLHDGGAIIYSQERITRGNKAFKVYKFRTMSIDAEKHSGPVLATDKDPRITPIGRFIRATRLDELPQLFNILKGEMSLVGPRPERQYFIDQFLEEIPDFKYRVTVKAGLTGLAQVLGKYSTTPQDKLRYDLLYIRNYSLLLDLKIILQTIKIVFMKESSSGVKDEEELHELLQHLNCKVYDEIGVTKIDY